MTCETNESLGYDADVSDPKQYCKHGTFIGSWWGPDYLCGPCEMGLDYLRTGYHLRRDVWVDGEFTGSQVCSGSKQISHWRKLVADDTGMPVFNVRVHRSEQGNRRVTLTSLNGQVQIVFQFEKYTYWSDEPDPNAPCQACDGKRWFISTRSDGHDAVERCDLCWDGEFSDEDAAKLAQSEGIACASTYPCYVIEEEN